MEVQTYILSETIQQTHCVYLILYQRRFSVMTDAGAETTSIKQLAMRLM